MPLPTKNSLAFPFPMLDGNIPIWNGSDFCLGNQLVKVLEYGANNNGWTDDLTEFHEETAGENHFIDKASRQHALDQIQNYVKGKNAIILEIGCSSGFMLDAMQKLFSKHIIIGSDVVRTPLIKLSQKIHGIPLLRFDLVDCPLPDNSVDVVVMLNVLEHIENDLGALRQVKRILKHGGIAIIEVPAGPNLYDIYDKLLMHYRRYSIACLQKKVKTAGFDIKKKSHLGFFIYPGFWFVKQRNKRLLEKSVIAQQQQVEKNIRDTGNNKILDGLMQLELLFGKKITYPIGVRCLMTCKKPVL